MSPSKSHGMDCGVKYSVAMDVPSMNGFFEFLAAKQTAWWRQQKGEKVKGKENRPYPYSEDDVIASHHILNCFRELDHETSWFRKRVHRNDLEETYPLNNYYGHGKSILSQSSFLTSALLFRMVDRASTFDQFEQETGMSPLISKENGEAWIEFVKRKAGRGERVFTGSHQTNGLRRYVEAVWTMLERGDEIWKRVESRKNLQQIHLTLRQEVPGVSGFFAWQTLADLLEADLVPFTEDDWAYLGPGPMRSMSMIMEGRPSQEVALSFLKPYVEKQEKLFRLTINEFLPPPGIDHLTLKNFEHSLCEYSRYIGFQWGSLGT